MILDMRRDDYSKQEIEQATVIVNARIDEIVRSDLECLNAEIISFESFKDKRVPTYKIRRFLDKPEYYCSKLKIIDLSRACSPDADLDSDEARGFYRLVKALKENTNIDIVATPELEKLFPILLQKNEEPDKLLEPYVIQPAEEKYSALQAVTKLQLALIEKKVSPELCREILEHNVNNNVVTQEVISVIDTHLSEETGQLDQYIPVLLGCMAGRYISPDNFDAVIDIAEKYIPKDHVTTEDINFCFGLQKESSQSEESSQRINSLIKELIPHLPEDVRQKLDEEAALKEKQQQEYLQKRHSLQAKVNEYSDYLLLSDAVYKDVSSDHIRKIGGTIFNNAEEYASLYEQILDEISEVGDEYKRRAAAFWIEPIILRIALDPNETNIELLDNLTRVVTENQDLRHEYGHIFCNQLKKNNDSEFWLERIKKLLNNNKDDHILLMNTYEDLEQAYKARPDLIAKSLDIFENSLEYPDIEKGFNDHLHTLASIVGDTAKEHPEFTDKAVRILSELLNIEKKLDNSSSQSYLRAKIDEAFDKIKQNEMDTAAKLDLVILHEKDPEIYAEAIKELMNTPKADQRIGNVIALRLNSGLNALVDDYDSPECLKWNLAVLQSEALQKKGPDEISACAEQIFKNGVLKQLENNPDYDPSETLRAIYDVAPFWLHKLREKISDEDDLFILQNFDRFPKDVQKLYIGEYSDKMDNLIKTDNLKNFPEIAAQKLKSEVCDFTFDISAESTYTDKRSISGMKKWAATLKEIGGYSSPEACSIALNEAMRIRETIAHPANDTPCYNACRHFPATQDDIKKFVKISTDIIDNVFEQISQHKNDPIFIDAIKKEEYVGHGDKASLQNLMGEDAANAFLSGDESYKKLWDRKMANDGINAYLMFEKPGEILQDKQHSDKITLLDRIRNNTYMHRHKNSWEWKKFPELLTSDELCNYITKCQDMADQNAVNAVKTFCKIRLNDKTIEDNYTLIKALMLTYDAEAKKGIEDKEIFSILYKARFSKYKDTVRANMKEICNDYGVTSPKLKSLSETSHLINKWMLKKDTNIK